jgi:hypothetical protein
MMMVSKKNLIKTELKAVEVSTAAPCKYESLPGERPKPHLPP